MRVLHIDRQSNWGGQLNRTVNIVGGLHDRGFDVAFVTHTASAAIEHSRERGVDPIVLPMRGSALWASMLRLRSRIGSDPYDIVHTHNARDQHIGLYLKLTGATRRLLRTRHSFQRFNSRFSKLPYRAIDAVVTTSQHVRTNTIEDGLPPEKVHAIYSSFDMQRFKPAPRDPAILEQWGVPSGAFLFGSVARLGENKGTSLLLEAWQHVLTQRPDRPTHLVLVGKNEKQYEPMAAALGISDRVTFTGFRDDVPRLLPQFDAFVLPTRFEALGGVFAEALACGVPAIAPRVGGVPEIVTEEVGRVIPGDDRAALADAMIDWLDHPERCAAMHDACRARAVALFDRENMVEQTIALYESLLP